MRITVPLLTSEGQAKSVGTAQSLHTVRSVGKTWEASCGLLSWKNNTQAGYQAFKSGTIALAHTGLGLCTL